MKGTHAVAATRSFVACDARWALNCSTSNADDQVTLADLESCEIM